MNSYEDRESTKQVFRFDRHGNVIRKSREKDGTWIYTVENRVTGERIAEIRFAPGRRDNRLTNGDLLEIVRDRLRAFNNSPLATRRMQNAEARVTEALTWVELAGLVKPVHIETDDEAVETEEEEG